jgi:hypothetical protein
VRETRERAEEDDLRRASELREEEVMKCSEAEEGRRGATLEINTNTLGRSELCLSQAETS